MKSQSPFPARAERAQDREKKREAVLRAAVRTFNAHGFYASSLDDVATSLGISKPTIYHHLGNKDQVLFECVSRGIEQLQEAAVSAHDAPGTGFEKLRAFLCRWAEINMDDFGRCVVNTTEEMLSPESAQRFRELKRGIDTSLRDMVKAGMDDGSLAPGDPKIVTFAIIGMLNWPARWFREDGTLSAADIATQLVELLAFGIATNK